MNLQNEKETLLNHISKTESVEKLELTITSLMFGLVMDPNKENEKEYLELLETSINRLKLVTLMNGTNNTLCHINLKDREKIELFVMLSMMKMIPKKDLQDIIEVDEQIGKYSMN